MTWRTQEEKEQWADDHGYWHGTCSKHGSFWTDGTGCESCQDEPKEEIEPEAGQFRCANCGEIFENNEKKMDEEFAYCPTCWLEF